MKLSTLKNRALPTYTLSVSGSLLLTIRHAQMCGYKIEEDLMAKIKAVVKSGDYYIKDDLLSELLECIKGLDV